MATDRRLVFRDKGDVKMVLDPQGNLLIKGDVRNPADGHGGLVFRSSERPDPCASIKSHGDLAHDGVLVAAAVAERVQNLPSEDRPSLRFARGRDVRMELTYLGRGDQPGGGPRLRGDLLRNFATRKNVGKMKPVERDNLRDAFIELQRRAYPGSRSDPIPGGVTYWFKQDEVHEATHVHAFPPYRGIAFLPWHRELLNRLEALLREVDPTFSLHYWDWQTDPRNSHGVDLMTPAFMGAPNGPAGDPWLSAGYYVPAADPHRDASGNPFDPPLLITRQMSDGAPGIPSDTTIISADAYPDMRKDLEDAHNSVHAYVSGTIGNAHTSFRDPFVFLLHSNLDRIWASWQRKPGKAWRLDPEQVYGAESNTDVNPAAGIYDPGILTPLDPWAGDPNNHPSVERIRPWAPLENEQVNKNSKHPSMVVPPLYDEYV